MVDYYKLKVTLKSGRLIKGTVKDEDDDFSQVIETVLRSMKSDMAGHFNIGPVFININEIAALEIRKTNALLGWLTT